MGPERVMSGTNRAEAVQSTTAITLQNNGKIWVTSRAEKCLPEASGGVEGIRTLETVSRLHP